MKKLTPPLKWHGGKHYLAKRIVSLFPPHLHYVEPYAGGLSVLLARDPDRDWLIDDAWKLKHGDKVPAALRGASEVVNDIDGLLMNFWSVLQDEKLFAKFRRKMAATPFAKTEYNRACAYLTVRNNRLNDAVLFFVLCRQSLAGRMKEFAPLSKTRTRRGVNEQASAWLNAIEGLPAIHARLKRVVILNDDALNVIRKQDGEKTLFYCDAPYVHETRMANDVYKHEMSDVEHEELVETLSAIKGHAIVSMYHHPIYERLSSEYGWNLVEYDLSNNASGSKSKRRMTECLWMNYDPPRSGIS
ncbi:hypothetical protein LCGC14_1857270 [marine sediment metagenome]|uniref:Uncharacterized protein n=1 Tax=marine sediment metagenome TaxID=412755 RepID=A0A0F9GWX8_9ZZZZ